MKNRIFIRPIFKEDWAEIEKIYRAGMETGIATFETTVPKWKTWKKQHFPELSLVAQFGDKIVGFVSLAPVSKRDAYKGVAELSIYIHPDFIGKGIGTKLMEEIIATSESHGFWTLQSGIFPENSLSIALHEKLGFRKIGFREKVAQRNGIWKDNVLMERRSKVVNWTEY